jgi:hypothetical protein
MPTRPPIGPSGWGTDAISGAASVPGHQRKDADEPVRDFSFIRLFNGAPELAERSEGWEQRPVLSQHDSGRSTREDQLPALIRALEIGKAEAEWARKEEERRSDIRKERWEEVKKEAFVRVAYERNPDRLRSELDRRDTAAAMSAYADEIDAHAAPALGAGGDRGQVAQVSRGARTDIPASAAALASRSS